MRNSILAVLVLAAVPAHANEFAPQLEQLAADALTSWATSPTVVTAVRQQNAANAGLSEAEIVALDNDWRAQVGGSQSPMIDDLLGRDGSRWLRDQSETMGGLISEVFVTDHVGLNVIQSSITSDYWQGDEAKWAETYGKPDGTIHLSDVEFDESSQTYQSQVSLPINDPESGEALGAITFGINVELLQ